jgi:colanic acid biosynthesis glycosyl transferase WcaI
VSLRPELEGLIVPSKFYGIAAAGRATIFIGDPDGEIAREVNASGSGLAVAQGDHVALATAIVTLAGDRDRCAVMGAAARSTYMARHDFPIALAAWADLFDSLGR